MTEESLSAAIQILNRARAHGGGPAETLPFAIAMWFGAWYLWDTASSPSPFPADSIPMEQMSQTEFLERAARKLESDDPRAAKAFQSLTANRLAEPLFAELLGFLGRDPQFEVQDRLIEALAESHKKTWAPDWLVRLAVSLLCPLGGTFYDGVAGVCGAAMEAYSLNRRRGGELQIFTQEISPLFHAVSILRIGTRAFSKGMALGNCLLEPLTDSTGLARFDWSVMFPPYGNRSPGAREILSVRKDLQPLLDGIPVNCDWLYVFHQLSCLNETGRGVCCVFSGLLFNERDIAPRKRLLELNVLDAIVSLPANCLPFTALPVSLLVLNKARKEGEMVKIVDAAPWIGEDFQMRGNRKLSPSGASLKALAAAYETGSFGKCAGALVAPADLHGDNLLPQRYITPPPMLVRDALFGALRLTDVSGPEWRSLKDVGTVFPGINAATKAIRNEEGNAGIINLSNVQDGALLRDTVERYHVPDSGRLWRYAVRAGDILISCKGPAVKLCMVPPDCEGLLMSLHFLGLRVDREKYDPDYVYSFLQSPVGQEALRRLQLGSSIVMIRAKDLEELRVPYLPLAGQKRRVQELQSEEARVSEEMEALRQRLRQARWNFYTQIGLTDVMQKED